MKSVYRHKPFNCMKCKKRYEPLPDTAIYYELCEECFARFNDQKMLGRLARAFHDGTEFEDCLYTGPSTELVEEWLANSRFYNDAVREHVRKK